MIFEFDTLTEAEQKALVQARKNKEQWISIGVDFVKSGKTSKEYAQEKGIVYSTFTKSMHRYKADIKAHLKLMNPNKTKEQWVSLGVQQKIAQEKGISLKQFTSDLKLNYETASRAFRKYAKEITLKKAAEDLRSKKGKLSKEDRKIKLINAFRSQLRVRASDSAAANNKKSVAWFNNVIKSSIRGHTVKRPQPGSIYAYVYDAKHKDTLPYWDKFPLIIYLGDYTAKNGNRLLLGLNLHYIPPKARQEFLEALLPHANTDSLSNKTRLKINWSQVRSMKGADQMIKAYLPGHIKGAITEIKPADWANVLYMPLQQFMSKGKRFSSRTVWRKS
ncbi:MAG: hypothetical protein [Caudoviricetes sp.]|nr:MAG: hypothetical protein [Caudoviricetes sp.]